MVVLSGIQSILPIISFLFVFILIYALLVKTKILGENVWVSLFLSLIIACFFIVNTRLVDFTQFNLSWFVVFIVCLFMILLVAGFLGKDMTEMLSKGAWGKGILIVVIIAIILLFVISSSFAFNWAINWDTIQNWFDDDWFGMTVLLVIAFIVSVVLVKSVKK
jgi:hypothetical protein